MHYCNLSEEIIPGIMNPDALILDISIKFSNAACHYGTA